jgi:hypothetical protein
MNYYFNLSSDDKIISTQEEIQNLIANNREEFEEFSELVLSEYTNKSNKGEIYHYATPLKYLFKNNEKLEELAKSLNCYNGTILFDEDSNILCQIIYPQNIEHYDFFILPIYNATTYYYITIVLENKNYTVDKRSYSTELPNIYISSFYAAHV